MRDRLVYFEEKGNGTTNPMIKKQNKQTNKQNRKRPTNNVSGWEGR